MASVPVNFNAGVRETPVWSSVGSSRVTVGDNSGIRAKPITPQPIEVIVSEPPFTVPALAIVAVISAIVPSVPLESS